MRSPDKSRICVTGGSGYIGSWVVKSLLEKGYTVHVTTRKKEKALYLKDIECATEENLKIFDGCDLSVPDSHDAAIEGCYAVIHCASPFFVAGGSRENLIDPAVKGTEMVLNACKKFKVQRVTLTGSVACVAQDFGIKVSASESGNHVYTSEDYSPVEINEEKKNYYPLSKIYAEKRAWELSKEEDCPYKLCVLLPGLVWGP